MTRDESIRRIRELSELTGLYEFFIAAREKALSAEWASGKAFEYLILRAFELDGADVVWPYEVRQGSDILEQIDGVVYADGLYCLIEAKDEREPINYEPIAKLRAQLQRRPGFVIGMVFSMSGFTMPAKQLARMTIPQSVLLWEGAEIESILSGASLRSIREALVLMARHAVEHALPDYPITATQ
jgi:hypothetical protein